jgi:hypothetical protein
MEMTTIALPKELKKKISELGMKGETFADILKRLHKSASERLLHDFLFDETDCVSIQQAIKEAKEKWPE